MNRAMGIKLQGLRLKVGMSGGGCVVIQATCRHWIAGWGGGEEEIEDFRGGVESHRAEWIRGLGRGSWLDESQASPMGALVLAEVDQQAGENNFTGRQATTSPAVGQLSSCTKMLFIHSSYEELNSLSVSLRLKPGISLVVQWLRLYLLMQRVQVQSLVWELRSHMPHGQKTKT